MLVELELDEEVVRLTEYIPANLRSEIFCDLIKQGIKMRNSTMADEDYVESSSSDIKRMIKLIESIAVGDITPTKAIVSKDDDNLSVTQEIEEKSIIVSLTGEDLSDFDDSDILDMLDIMK